MSKQLLVLVRTLGNFGSNPWEIMPGGAIRSILKQLSVEKQAGGHGIFGSILHTLPAQKKFYGILRAGMTNIEEI